MTVSRLLDDRLLLHESVLNVVLHVHFDTLTDLIHLDPELLPQLERHLLRLSSLLNDKVTFLLSLLQVNGQVQGIHVGIDLLFLLPNFVFFLFDCFGVLSFGLLRQALFGLWAKAGADLLERFLLS